MQILNKIFQNKNEYNVIKIFYNILNSLLQTTFQQFEELLCVMYYDSKLSNSKILLCKLN